MYAIKKKGLASARPAETRIKGLYDRAVEYIQARRNKVVPAIAAVVLGALIAASYAFVQTARDSKASALLSQALEYYSPTTGIPADYSKSLELFRDIAKSYSGTTSGAIAEYYAAASLAAMGRIDEALSEYKDLVSRHSSKRLIAGLAYQRMGYLYASKGNTADAIKAFEQADRLLGAGLATIELARLYDKTGDAEKSQKMYKAISDKLPGTQWALEAMTKLPPPVRKQEQQAADKK